MFNVHDRNTSHHEFQDVSVVKPTTTTNTWSSALGIQIESPLGKHDLGATAWNPSNHGAQLCKSVDEETLQASRAQNNQNNKNRGPLCQPILTSKDQQEPHHGQLLQRQQHTQQHHHHTQQQHQQQERHIQGVQHNNGSSCVYDSSSKSASLKLTKPSSLISSTDVSHKNKAPSPSQLTQDQMTWLLQRRLQKFAPLMVGLGRNTLSDMDEPAWIARGGAYGVNVPKGAAKKLVLVFRPPYKTGHKISTTEPPPWTWIEGFVQAPAILPTLFTPSTKVDDDNPSNEHEKELDNNIGELREEIRELTTVNKQLKSSLQKRVGHLEYEITFLRKENKLMAKQVKDQGKRSEVQLDLLNRENSNLRLKILSLTSQLELRGEIPKSTSLSLDW